MAEKYGKPQTELNELDIASLVEELHNAKQDALDSRFKLATGQLTDTHASARFADKSPASTLFFAVAKSRLPRQ